MQANPTLQAVADRSPGLLRAVVRRLQLRRRHRLAVEGYVFIGIMALVGFAAWHSGTNLLYLMFAMMIAFFLMQGILVSVCLKGLRVSRRAPSSVCADEELRVPFTVENRKRLFASYALRVVDYLADGRSAGTGFVVRIPARAVQEHEYCTVFTRRGLVRLDHLEVITRYPFGLVQRSFFVDSPVEIIVYPQIVDVRPALPCLQMDIGDHPTRRKGMGVDLYGLREYAQGGHARHIHWRSTAKTRKLMLREFEKEERRKVTLLLRNRVEASKVESASEEFEKAVIFAASLARLLVREDFEVQLETDSGVVPYGSGGGHLERMLRALALIGLCSASAHACDSDAGSPDILHVSWGNGVPRTAAAGRRILDVRDWQIVPRRTAKADLPQYVFVPRRQDDAADIEAQGPES